MSTSMWKNKKEDPGDIWNTWWHPIWLWRNYMKFLWLDAESQLTSDDLRDGLTKGRCLPWETEQHPGVSAVLTGSFSTAKCQTLSCKCLNWICGYLNLREMLLVPAAWRTVRQTSRGGLSTKEDMISGGSDVQLWSWGTACAEQLTPFTGTSQRVTNTNHRESPQLISSLQYPMWEPHIVQHWPKCYFSGYYFFSWGFFFFFLVDHTKNNPSGKDVVWLSEKAAPSPYKFSLQVLLSMTERFIISMWSLNVCEVPQNCEQGLVMLRRTTLSLLGIFCTFVKLKVLSKAPRLESGSCCNPNNWLWDCKCCVLFLCAMFQAHSQGTLCSDHLLVSALFHTSKTMPSNLISQPNFLSPSNIFFPGHQWFSLTFCNNATLPGIMPEVSAWLAII